MILFQALIIEATFFRNCILCSLTASSSGSVSAEPKHGVLLPYTLPLAERRPKHLIQLLGSKGMLPFHPQTLKQSMIAEYPVGLGAKVDHGVPGRFHDHHVVLLTGSTGGLGSYLLASLLSHEDVGLVYAFNRPSKTGTIQQRQCAAFEDRGLDTTLLHSAKLIYIEGDTSRPDLSLDDWIYTEIQDSVTVIIHNAWQLDFNLSLSSFEPHVRGTRNLIDLARRSMWAAKPRFLFTSSIASAQGWDKNKGAFPEEVQYDAVVAMGSGYGASKYVSERILATSGLAVTSFRIGQITGGVPRGAWSTSNWVPIIVKSSIGLGTLPDARGVISWLPPHAVSNAILDVAFANEEPPIAVNLVHPQPSTWQSVMLHVSENLYQKRLTPSRLPLIPFTRWVERLEEQATSVTEAQENARRVPAIKLLGFVHGLAQGDATLRHHSKSSENMDEIAGLPKFATDIAQRVSETMRDLEPLSAKDVERWIEYWTSVGMFK